MNREETRLLTIYALCDPRIEGDDGVRYIGATVNLKGRISYHLCRERNMPEPIPQCFESFAPVYHWIRELRQAGFTPTIRVLQESACAADEMRIIRRYREMNAPILNVRPHPYCLAASEMTNWNELPLFMTVKEAAAAIGIGKNQAYEAVRTGEIPSVRIGRKLLVPRAGLERLQTQGEPSPAAKLQEGQGTR